MLGSVLGIASHGCWRETLMTFLRITNIKRSLKEAFLGLDGELPGGEGPHPLLLADGLQALLVGGHALADGAGQLLAKVDGGVLLALEETKEKSVR